LIEAKAVDIADKIGHDPVEYAKLLIGQTTDGSSNSTKSTTNLPYQPNMLNLQCPMPQLDFDVIMLGHGSGGLLTHRLLSAGVFSVLQNEWLDQQHDGAVLPLGPRTAFTTDSFVVSPLFFPGGNIGDLAVNGTINDLAMCGAAPQFLSLSFILEEGLAMTEFWAVLTSIAAACQYAGVRVVTGDTKVVERGKGDKLFVNMSGLGQVHPQADIAAARVRPGDRVIVSGEIATHGIAIMSVREGIAFEADLASDTRALHRPVLHLLDQFGPHIHFLRDPTRGGVASALNELAQTARLGIGLHERHLPLNDTVRGACEMLGLDPLYVANEGIFLAVVAPEVADQVVEALRTFPECAQASIIGQVGPDHPGQVLLTSSIGGRRVVQMLPGEQLPRIC
jgi:hydrogenase expression/formation protein HypE